MKVLTLSIKQKWFDEIVEGTKKCEYREVRPNNFARYCRYVHDGKEYVKYEDVPDDGKDCCVKPLKYDALKLVTGAYKEKRPYIVIAVTDAKLILYHDDKGEPIIYEHEGQEYVRGDIEYHLGEIIEKYP